MYIQIFLLSVFLFFVYFLYQNNQNVLSERISSKESLVRTSNVDSGEYKRPTDITGKIQIIESYNYNEFTIPREYPSKNVYLERKENSGLCYFYGEKSKSIRKNIGKSTYDYYSNVEFRSEISDENSKTWKVVAQISGPRISGGISKCGVLLFNLNDNVDKLVKFLVPGKKIEVMEKDLTKINKKVLEVIYNPQFGRVSLIQKYKFYNPSILTRNHINFFSNISQKTLNYTKVQTLTFNRFPPNKNKIYYNEKNYDECYKQDKNCLNLGEGDYLEMLKETKACELLNSGKIDELWVYSPPLTGFYESNMAGPNNQVFDINSSPTLDSNCKKLLPIMGFNYEVDRGIHNFGHRAERTLMKVFNGTISDWRPGMNTGFNRFTMSDKNNPGKAACGDIHLTPSSKSDYDYYTGDYSSVKSNCYEYANYPLINFEYRDVHCEMWGGCDEIGFFKFWWSNFPKNKGTNFDNHSKKKLLNNWWLYVFEPQNALK